MPPIPKAHKSSVHVGAGSSTAATGTVSAPPDQLPVPDLPPSKRTARTETESTLSSISERFPLDDLSELEATGLKGQTFMLDGGALNGLKLRVRRVQNADTPGFEINFALTSSKLDSLYERLVETEGSKKKSLVFRGATVGSDSAVAQITKDQTEIIRGSSHAPEDLGALSNEWVISAKGPRGGTVELCGPTSAPAARGLMRIRLEGDDDACTAQLQAIVKRFGLGQIFAPPTPKSKRTNLLMQALWQADHEKAKSLAQSGHDKLSPEQVEAALEEAGYPKERVESLRYEEVYGGHFAVYDPVQADQLMRAGARYLYSTVQSVDHVLTILKEGQASSLDRYTDGKLISGNSSMEDFSSGGAVGVFTRLVTQNALYRGASWSGRPYKLIQSYEQLGRTDWHGWDSDYYGRRWGLSTEKNFGLGLISAIDKGGNYQSGNELVFAGGNRPEQIQRVVATERWQCDNLISYLESEGFEPPNGLSLEEFVVHSPNVLFFGPAPYDADEPGFVEDALERAKSNDLAPLQWLLFEAPSTEKRAMAEKEVLLSGDETLQRILIQAAKNRGSLALGGDELTEALQELEKDDPHAIRPKLATAAPLALLCSGSEAAVAMVEEHPSWSSMTQQNWLSAFEAILPDSGPARDRALQLATEKGAPLLLQSKHASFFHLLETHPLVSPEDPEAFLASAIEDLKEDKERPDLELFIAQNRQKPRLSEIEKSLIQADHPKTKAVLQQFMPTPARLSLDGETLFEIFSALPADSVTRSYLSSVTPDALLATGHPGFLEYLEASTEPGACLGVSTSESWSALVTELLDREGPTPYLRRLLEIGSHHLARSQFLTRLSEIEELFDVSDPKAFAAEALTQCVLGGPGAIKLLWALGSESVSSEARIEIGYQLVTSGLAEGPEILSGIHLLSADGGLPFSEEELFAILERLVPEDMSDHARAFLRRAGPQILAGLTEARVPVVEALLDDVATPLTDLGVGRFSHLRPTLEALEGRDESDRRAALDFILRKAGKRLLLDRDKGFVSWLRDNELGFSDLHISPEEAADGVRDLVEYNEHYYSMTPDKAPPSFSRLPESLVWLLSPGPEGRPYDEEVLGKIEEKLPGWKWKDELREGFLERLPDLPSEWRDRLSSAKGGMLRFLKRK